MPVFSPRRYQPPFHPVQKETSIPLRMFTAFERTIKGTLFGCRMCGNCILQETAFICPMTCPKGLRNGLCGGASPDHCEVDPSRPCTWYKIYERAERLGRLDRLLEINAPIDGARAGGETWLEVVRTWLKDEDAPRFRDFIGNRETFDEAWDQMFYNLRQPDWWQGDAEYHPPQYDEPLSLLEANLRTGNFVTTAEIAPPLDASPALIYKKVGWLEDYVAAANFTDNASASARMNSMASSKLCLDAGLEPVMQLQARDRSRVILEADAMGAAGLGIRNVLCLSGDHQSFGPGPIVKPDQFDMDAVQLLWMLRRMRDEGIYLDGRKIKTRPQLFLGAAASPFGAPPAYEAIRAEKKINAGAQFIQTQPVYDYDRFLEWLEALDRRNLLDKVYILAGLIPLKSARAAHFMADEVPGVVIPPHLVKRMDDAGDDKEAQQETGVAIALELIEKLRQTPGIDGMHIMAVHWESIVPRLMDEGQLPRPAIHSLELQEA
ncbi:MAG TPA: methylenetetrahydrofolate reductase C-terminal domain-containing protein [Candidatus Sulfomarinibacteraceae bacterium]|nr:methylenetetrahydrofolate reductase C-terminal domain-containing protein [Candidatus Sulfomarinibacteraceae bacterium]